MKFFAFVLVFLLGCSYSIAQENPSKESSIESPAPKEMKCSTHTRGFWNGHWFSSNMCPEDYQNWLSEQKFHSAVQDKWFWTGEATMGTALAADLWTTSRAIGNGFVEGNTLLLGSRPTNGRIIEVGSLVFAGYTGLNYAAYRLGQKDPSKAWRVFSRLAVPVPVVLGHGIAAIHNNSCCQGKWKP